MIRDILDMIEDAKRELKAMWKFSRLFTVLFLVNMALIAVALGLWAMWIFKIGSMGR